MDGQRPSTSRSDKSAQSIAESTTDLDKLTKINEEVDAAASETNSPENFVQQSFEINVLRLILASGEPLSTVETPSFRKIIDDASDVPVKHMSQHDLSLRIQEIYRTQIDNIRTQLKNNAAYVCTTVDIFTSENHRFLCTTAHWIDSQHLKRRSVAIACRRFPASYTFDRILNSLGKIHASLGLDSRKIIATMTDNVSDPGKNCLVEAVSESDESSDSDSDMSCDTDDDSSREIEYAIPAVITEEVSTSISSNPRNFKSASHILNLLATTEVLKTVRASKLLSSQYDEVMARCQCLWKILRSPKRRKKLKNILGQRISRPRVEQLNSLLSSLQKIYDLREEIIEASRILDVSNPLRETDYKFIAEYISCLRPIAESLDRLRRVEQSFYGYLLPDLIILRRKLNENKLNGRLEYCETIAADLIRNLEYRFSDFFEVVGLGTFAAVAAVLQPKFKTRWVKYLSPAAQVKVKEAAMTAAKEASVSSSICQSNEVREIRVNDDDFNFGEDDEFAICTDSSLGETIIEKAMRKYMCDPCSDDISVINRYPGIKDLFVLYNTPLISSPPVEKIFPYEMMRDLPRQDRLNNENFKIRMLAKCYFNVS